MMVEYGCYVEMDLIVVMLKEVQCDDSYLVVVALCESVVLLG